MNEISVGKDKVARKSGNKGQVVTESLNGQTKKSFRKYDYKAVS